MKIYYFEVSIPIVAETEDEAYGEINNIAAELADDANEKAEKLDLIPVNRIKSWIGDGVEVEEFEDDNLDEEPESEVKEEDEFLKEFGEQKEKQ
jgi:hypothetical protein